MSPWTPKHLAPPSLSDDPRMALDETPWTDWLPLYALLGALVFGGLVMLVVLLCQ